MPHSARNASVAASNAPLPGRAKRTYGFTLINSSFRSITFAALYTLGEQIPCRRSCLIVLSTESIDLLSFFVYTLPCGEVRRATQPHLLLRSVLRILQSDRLYAHLLLFSRHQVTHCHQSSPLLILSNDQGKGNLFLCCQAQTCTDAMSCHIDFCSYATATCSLCYMQSILRVQWTHRNHERLRCRRHRQGMTWNKREQSFNTEGKTTSVHIARATHSVHEAIITPATTYL